MSIACERLNSTLAQSLRAYCSKEQENWSRILPSVMMAFRMSPTQSTQFSPYYMLFGKEMPLPRMNLLLKVYIDILLLFLAALLRCPCAIGQKHLELVMVVKGHYGLVYSF
jgi:hypothetical protein